MRTHRIARLALTSILAACGLSPLAAVAQMQAVDSTPIAAVRVISPFAFGGADARVGAGATQITIDRAAYTAMKGRGWVTMAGLPLEAGRAATPDMVLEQFDVVEPWAKLVEMTDHGEVPLPPATVEFWHGSLAGDPAARVFLAISPTGMNGFVGTQGRTYIISSGPADQLPTVIYEQHDEAGRAANIAIAPCAGELYPPGVAPPIRPNTPEDSAAVRSYTCRQFDEAIETDNEFATRLGSTAAAQNYAMTLLAAASEIYARDMNARLKLSYLRIWTTSDPWSGTDTPSQLDQFVNYWNTNMGSVQRDLAHMMSTRPLGGGIAYLDAACTSYGYGVSGNLAGSFPYPLVNHSSNNWDINVVAHEIGHNLGTGHTHEIDWYNPIIDGCGLGYVGQTQDCSQAFNGTIMSYCHLCPGGEANINLTFGPRVITVMRSYMDTSAASCSTVLPAVTQNPGGSTINEGDPISFTGAFDSLGTVSYQWRRGGVNLNDDARIHGSHTPTLSISPTVVGDQASYDLQIISTSCTNTTTQPAALFVNATCPAGNPRPSIGGQPSDLSVIAGTQAQFTVSASGEPSLSYQWRRGLIVLSNTATMTGVDTPTLTINPADYADSGGYNCVVTGSVCSSTSAQATLLVTPPPPGPFALSFPAPGATGVSATPTLAWDTSSAATSYTVKVSLAPSFASTVFSLQTTSNFLPLTPGTLQSSTTYWWKVEANNGVSVTQSTPVSASFTTATPPPPCRADLDNNRVVNSIDLAIVLSAFGNHVTPGQPPDINGDGQVNSPDLGFVLSEFGRSDCP